MKNSLIIFITGASGAGKTTLLNALKEQHDFKEAIFLNFDSIGVPSEDEMIRQYGSPSEWQKATTHVWAEKINSEYKGKKLVILEGQVNLDFIAEAFNKFNHQVKVILIHCSDAVRHKRLHGDRNQPELVNKNMDNWSAYLKKQALGQEAVILDTTSMDVDEMVAEFKKNIINF